MHVGARNRPNSRAKSITLFATEFLRPLHYQLLTSGSGVARRPLLSRNKVRNRFSLGVKRVILGMRLRYKYRLSIDTIYELPLSFFLFIVPFQSASEKRFLRRFSLNDGTHTHEGHLDIER